MDALVKQCLDQAPSTAARAHLLSLVECLWMLVNESFFFTYHLTGSNLVDMHSCFEIGIADHPSCLSHRILDNVFLRIFSPIRLYFCCKNSSHCYIFREHNTRHMMRILVRFQWNCTFSSIFRRIESHCMPDNSTKYWWESFWCFQKFLRIRVPWAPFCLRMCYLMMCYQNWNRSSDPSGFSN